MVEMEKKVGLIREDEGNKNKRKREEGGTALRISEKVIKNYATNDPPKHTYNTCKSEYKYTKSVEIKFSHLG